MSAAFTGLDLAMLVFQVHGADIHGKVVAQRLHRDADLALFANLAPCVVSLEACAESQLQRAQDCPVWPRDAPDGAER